nr:phosphate ABC transporter permease subunit PstC [Natranaerovirga pectinivora]
MKNKSKDMTINKKRERYEFIAEKIFFLCAFIAVFSVIAISIFVFYKGLQPFFATNEEGKYSFLRFVTGLEWRVYNNNFGVLYMMIGSVLASTGAILIGVPVGLFTAVFISELAPNSVVKVIKPAVEILAGIPSVLYGVFGLGIIVPSIMRISPQSRGQSLLAVIIVLSIMILPTVIAISETALRSVPKAYREGSLALGASKTTTIFKVTIPSAKSGILAGVVLGIGRAIGETMAVMLVAGNPEAGIPLSIFDQIRPLTTNIAMEMGYATGLHQQMLFATGVVLFMFIILLNLVLNKITSKAGDK